MISSRTKFNASEGIRGSSFSGYAPFLGNKVLFVGGTNFLGKKYRGVLISWEISTPGVLFSWEYLFSVAPEGVNVYLSDKSVKY